MSNTEINTTHHSRIIPVLHIEDGLNFQDFLLELHVTWDQLNNTGKISLISEYLSEESNADFFIEEVSETEIGITCSRLSDQVLVSSNNINEINNEISIIISKLIGCAFQS